VQQGAEKAYQRLRGTPKNPIATKTPQVEEGASRRRKRPSYRKAEEDAAGAFAEKKKGQSSGRVLRLRKNANRFFLRGKPNIPGRRKM